MPITPILRDDNGVPLSGRGSQTITKRYANVGQTPLQIAFPVDVKEAVIHIEGSSVLAAFTGTVSGSETIHWTSDGVTLPPIAVAVPALEPIMLASAVSGTMNVSVLAWR